MTMTPEKERLKEHAETIINCTTKVTDEFGTCYKRDESEFCFGLTEPFELASYYLTHLAETAKREKEDGEPVTEAWLLVNGFTWNEYLTRMTFEIDLGDNRVILVCYERDCKFFISAGEKLGGRSSIAIGNHITTIGQLRKLLEGLGN